MTICSYMIARLLILAHSGRVPPIELASQILGEERPECLHARWRAGALSHVLEVSHIGPFRKSASELVIVKIPGGLAHEYRSMPGGRADSLLHVTEVAHIGPFTKTAADTVGFKRPGEERGA